MTERLEFLKNTYIPNKLKKHIKTQEIQSCLDYSIENYKKIESNFLMYKRMYMKFQLTNKKDIILKIIEGIKITMELEKNTLEALLPQLKIIGRSIKDNGYYE